MSTGMVIEVGRSEAGADRRATVPVVGADDLRARYDRLVTLVLRMGTWLNSPQAALLAPDAWEAHFARYQERLADVRRLGDELRPTSLRSRTERLAGDALVDEVMELFAA